MSIPTTQTARDAFRRIRPTLGRIRRKAVNTARKVLPARRVHFDPPEQQTPSPFRAVVDSDNELERLGAKYQPTKRNHNYLPHYWMHFRDIRESVANVIEIGVQTDRSVRMWEEFFPNAIIHGIDIDPACKAFEGDRRRIHIADQADTAALHRIAEAIDGSIDIVIDDGSHRPAHQISSFETLFPLLSDHGLYVIEDTGGVVGDMSLTTVRALQGLIGGVMYWPRRTAPSDWPSVSQLDDRATWADRHVVGVAFYRWIAFVTKGHNPGDNPYLGHSAE